jgi:hypothetical protein
LNENTTLTCTETFTAGVLGADLPELRARAWDSLSTSLGTEQARDNIDAWVLTKLATEPNPAPQSFDDDGNALDKYSATAIFTRSEPAAASRV